MAPSTYKWSAMERGFEKALLARWRSGFENSMLLLLRIPEHPL
jgi:hypothetical protein